MTTSTDLARALVAIDDAQRHLRQCVAEYERLREQLLDEACAREIHQTIGRPLRAPRWNAQ